MSRACCVGIWIQMKPESAIGPSHYTQPTRCNTKNNPIYFNHIISLSLIYTSASTIPTTHTTFQQTNLETLSKCWVNVGLCSWVNANLAIYGHIAAESALACIFMFCQAVPWIYAWPRKASWSVYGFRLDLSFTGGGGGGSIYPGRRRVASIIQPPRLPAWHVLQPVRWCR